MDKINTKKPVGFCKHCHKPIFAPKWIENVNMKGNIKISCGNCKVGSIKIKPQPITETPELETLKTPIENE